MNLNDFIPCVCENCRKQSDSRKIDIANTMYFKEDNIPEVCPICSAENTVRPLVRICLVKAMNDGGVFKASDMAKRQNPGVKKWTYYCERSCDEHSKQNLPTHTVLPECCNCPECLVKYNEALELANQFLKVRV